MLPSRRFRPGFAALPYRRATALISLLPAGLLLLGACSGEIGKASGAGDPGAGEPGANPGLGSPGSGNGQPGGPGNGNGSGSGSGNGAGPQPSDAPNVPGPAP